MAEGLQSAIEAAQNLELTLDEVSTAIIVSKNTQYMMYTSV